MVTEVLNPTVGIFVTNSFLGDHTCFFFNDSPVLIAVNMLLEPGTELHIAHIIQKNIDDRPSPATYLWSRNHFTKLQGKTDWLPSVGHKCTCGNSNCNSPDSFDGTPPSTSGEGNHQFPFRKLQLKLVLFQLRVEPPLCNHRRTQIPDEVLALEHGIMLNCLQVSRSYFHWNARAEELCPKLVKGCWKVHAV